MKTYPCILQASLQSKRLTRKVLKLIGRKGDEKPMWLWAAHAALSSPHVSRLYIDIPSDGNEEDLITSINMHMHYHIRAGKVLIIQSAHKQRFPTIARAVSMLQKDDKHARAVFRITADCPFLDPLDFGRLARVPYQRRKKVVATRSDSIRYQGGGPPGSDIEFINLQAAQRCGIGYLYQRTGFFYILPFSPPYREGLSFTVDTQEDLDNANTIAASIHYPYSQTIVEWDTHGKDLSHDPR